MTDIYKGLSFSAALESLKVGNKIRRREWYHSFHIYLHPTYNVIVSHLGVTWKPNQIDLLREDWEILK